jgi:cytochrome bd-type quinol oxidase subunit 2
VWDLGERTLWIVVAGLCAFSFFWGVAASVEQQRELSFFGVLVSLSVQGAQEKFLENPIYGDSK